MTDATPTQPTGSGKLIWRKPLTRDARIAELEAALKVIGALTMTPGAMSCVAISQIVNDALMPAPERDMVASVEELDA